MDLPKDVAWLILRDAIMDDALLSKRNADYWETPHTNQFPEISEKSSHTGFVTRNIALICKFTLNIVSSKCIRKGNRNYSFIKGALTGSY